MAKLLKDKFQDFEPDLEKDVWANIEKELKKEKKTMLWLNWKPMMGIAAAVTLFATSIVVWKILPTTEKKVDVSTTESKKTVTTFPAETIEKTQEEGVAETQESKAPAISEENEQAELSAQTVANHVDTRKSSATKKVVKTYIVQVTETVSDNSTKNDNQIPSREVMYKEVKIEPKKVAPANNSVVNNEIPAKKEEVKTENVADNLPLPKTHKPVEWIVYEAPESPKKSIAKTVANRPNKSAPELDLDNFSLDNAIQFVASKFSKTADAPVKAEQRKDGWKYLFKLKKVEVEHTQHREL